MYSEDIRQVGNENASPVSLGDILSNDIYPEVFYLILTNLHHREDYESLRQVSSHVKRGMDSFKADTPLRFQSLFSPNICVQGLKAGILAMCTHYLSTTSFGAFSFGSGPTGKHRAERLRELANMCAPENVHLLVLAVQKLPSTKLLNMINEYYSDEKVINPHLFKRAVDTRSLFGKGNTANRDMAYRILMSDLQKSITDFSSSRTVKNAIDLLLRYIDNQSNDGVSSDLFTALLTVPMIENAAIAKDWVQAVEHLRQAVTQAEAAANRDAFHNRPRL